jgi:hypothetical protein
VSDLLQISKPSGKEAREARERAAETPRIAIVFPYKIDLPTKYYGRLALEETIRDFAEIASVEHRVGDGFFHVTFHKVDAEAGEVVDEFLNHVLYRSATSGEEASR